MKVQILKDVGPGCIHRPGSVLQMDNKRARHLIERGYAVQVMDSSGKPLPVRRTAKLTPVKGLTLNILTRTGNRPNRFRRCRESVKAQEWGGKIRHIVSIDCPCDYVEANVVVPAYGDVSPSVPVEQMKHRDAPYNLYVNDLLAAVNDGWILVLDDDDELLTADAIAKLEPHMDDEDNLIVSKFAMGSRNQTFIMPKAFGRELVMNDVPCSCYIYHSKHKAFGLWHTKYAGDYYAAHNLSEKLNTVWVDEVTAGTQAGPSVGGEDTKKYRPWKPREIKEDKKSVLLSIVIPVMNQSHYTARILEQIKNTVHIPYEVIVVDNASTDDTPAILKKSEAIVIHNDVNAGVSISWNQGCRLAKGTHIAVLNNDLVLPDGWAETLISHGEHAICPMYKQFGEVRKDFDAFNVKLKSKQLKVVVAERPGRHPKGFAGFLFMLSREAWERVGPFDEDFRLWYGDNDYWLRLKDMGYQPMQSRSVEIHHFVRKTSDALPNFQEQRDKDRHLFEVKWPHEL